MLPKVIDLIVALLSELPRHEEPLSEIRTCPEFPPATQPLFPYAIDLIPWLLRKSEVTVVQVTPSVEVRICPELPPAIHRPFPYVIGKILIVPKLEVRVVQVTPLVEVRI